MKKIFGAIFGTPKTLEAIVDGAVSGIDKLIFTDEEKAETNQQIRGWMIEYLKATQPQNVARRFMAITITLMWACLILLGVALYKIDMGYSAWIFSVLDNLVNQPFMILMSFYFLARVANTYIEGKNGAHK